MRLHWKQPATTSLAFAIYAGIMGFSLLLIPDVILPIFGLSEPEDMWVRAAGAIALALAYYYVEAWRTNNLAFIKSTLIGRGIFATAIIGLVVTDAAEVNMLLFAFLDMASAGWTFYALQAMRRSG